ncbi:MAG TPA: cation:proton antiporter [Candidatus Nanoarchaeia archaeon]|nr:cation:proton antiporter [Candidatus Nanoarchaeia archaeon]
MINQFIQFGLILLVVFGVSLVIRLLKQPLIIGYIISGILVGPLFFNLINGSETISVFSEMGIAFLLFIVGLHLSPKVIKEVGKVSLVTGLGQIIFTSIIGYFIGVMLGFSVITSIYIAIALTFSSTIIIMKLLSDKDALEKLYGKISIGFLLVQDLAAILILIVVSSLSNGTNVSNLFFSTILKGLAIVALLIPIAYYFLPKMEDFFAKSQEFLFLFSLSWGFALAMLFLYAGFSIEVGALIAGIMLSMSPYSYEISSKLKPLRDFFIIFFFIILGSQMVFGDISNLIVPAIIFSLFILIGNPLIVMVLMGLLGYSKKTGFMAGLTVAQISEFSLILIALGVRVGHLSNEILSFVTLIGLITIAGSTYMIIYSDSIYNKISKSLSIFERKDIQEKKIAKKNYKYILLGHNRIGFSIIKAFSRITNNFLVVDYNPEIVRDLRKMRIRAVYGDVDDSEFLEDIGISKASLIVSTVPDIETNHLILDVLKRNKSSAIKILTARQISDAVELYNSGADYVILPHFLGGEYTAKLIRGAKDDKSVYEKEKIKELKILKERFLKKQDHPEVEKD